MLVGWMDGPSRCEDDISVAVLSVKMQQSTASDRLISTAILMEKCFLDFTYKSFSWYNCQMVKKNSKLSTLILTCGLLCFCEAPPSHTKPFIWSESPIPAYHPRILNQAHFKENLQIRNVCWHSYWEIVFFVQFVCCRVGTDLECVFQTHFLVLCCAARRVFPVQAAAAAAKFIELSLSVRFFCVKIGRWPPGRPPPSSMF